MLCKINFPQSKSESEGSKRSANATTIEDIYIPRVIFNTANVWIVNGDEKINFIPDDDKDYIVEIEIDEFNYNFTKAKNIYIVDTANNELKYLDE